MFNGVDDIIIKMEPSTMHNIIPHAPKTSPIERAAAFAAVDDAVGLDVQLIKLENKSGEELHHDSNTAITIPVLCSLILVEPLLELVSSDT